MKLLPPRARSKGRTSHGSKANLRYPLTIRREVVTMPFEVKKLEVWTGEIDDQVGGLASRLEPLANAGVDLQFLVARRQAHLPGRGVVFLSGISGARGTKAAAAAGSGRRSRAPGRRSFRMRRTRETPLFCGNDAGRSRRGPWAGPPHRRPP